MKNKKKKISLNHVNCSPHLGVENLRFYKCLKGLDQDDINASA